MEALDAGFEMPGEPPVAMTSAHVPARAPIPDPFDEAAERLRATPPKGSCTLSHRGVEFVMHNPPGRRIVSVSYYVPRYDAEPLATGSRKLKEDLGRHGCPSEEEAVVFARWYDPSDETARFRVGIPHARFTSWRDRSNGSVSPTRSNQRLDDRIEVLTDGIGPSAAPSKEVVGAAPRATPVAWSATDLRTSPVRTTSPLNALLPVGRSTPLRQVAMLWSLVVGVAVTSIMGGALIFVAGTLIVYMMLDIASYYMKIETIAPAPHPNMRDRSKDRPESTEWDAVRKAVSLHAPGRADEVARAEMRVRSLVDSTVPTTNQSVVESIARISGGLRTLVQAHRGPASIATGSEAGQLAERLADSVVALGCEAEDARLIAFRDASVDFETAARLIQARNDRSLSIVDGREDA